MYKIGLALNISERLCDRLQFVNSGSNVENTMKETHYEIEKPALSETPNYELLGKGEVSRAIIKAQENYLCWKQFKYKDWVPGKKEEVWSLVKLYRQINSESTPILDENRERFTFNPRSYVEFLHKVDLELGGVFAGIEDFNQGDRKQIIRRNLIEESIASSQLEGANTSRAVAKKMLTEGREPKDKSEQMIVNNHETMKWIEEEFKRNPLTMDNLFELHKRITYKTIDEGHQGILRETLDEDGKPLVIKPWDNLVIAYTAPKREFVEEQLPLLIKFANDEDNEHFIHPLTKAIMIHFWIGLLHPFEDGNGRLARILFYWYMLKKGYWAFSFLSISERILKSPKQYAMAFINSEQDDNDLNYFIHYNVSKIKLARRAFSEHIAKRIKENRQVSSLVRLEHGLNKRQINLLQYLAKDEQRYTTLSQYHNINDEIGRVTAASDLKKLVESNFLSKIRSGRNIYYYPTNKLKKLISET